MLFRLILLFTILPVVEIYLLFKLAEATSWTEAIVIVIATGVVGATLAKIQGLAVWRRVGDCLRRGELPADALIEGLIIFFGGVVLITPGLLTDFVGLLTLFPPTRRLFRSWIKRQITRFLEKGSARIFFRPNRPGE